MCCVSLCHPLLLLDFMVGYSAESARPVIDPASWRNVIMLPNPAEGIEADGFITQWQLFAIKEGKVALLVSIYFSYALHSKISQALTSGFGF